MRGGDRPGGKQFLQGDEQPGIITRADAERLAQALAEKLQQARSVSDSEHFDHHKWISQRIRAEEERRAFYKSLSDRLAEKSLWGLLAVMGLLMWHGLEFVIKKMGSP